MYSEVNLSKEHELSLLAIMKGSDQDALSNCAVRLQRLNDPTPPENGGFSQNQVSDFIFAITPYSAAVGKKQPPKYLILDMAFLGFLIHIFAPRLPYPRNRKPGFLKRRHGLLHAPATDMMKYPPMMDCFVSAVKKDYEGLVTPAVGRWRKKV